MYSLKGRKTQNKMVPSKLESDKDGSDQLTKTVTMGEYNENQLPVQSSPMQIRSSLSEPVSLIDTSVPTSDGKLILYQVANFLMMMSSLVIIFGTAILRGTEISASIFGIDRCSLESTGILVAAQIISFMLAFFAYSKNKNAMDRRDNDDPKKSNMRCNIVKRRKKLILASYLTGVAAGGLGVGGGTVLSPYMLDIGMDPITGSALSGFCVLFTSSSTSFQFAMGGAIKKDHGLILTLFSLIGATLGSIIVKRYIVNRGKAYLVIWIIFFILVASLFVLPVQMYFELKTQVNFFETGKPC